jgi:uncharacterized protein (DUF934 family)
MADPLFFRDGAPVAETPVPLADFLAGVATGSNAAAVRLEPADDARALVPHLDRLALIEVAFPAFRDGRGYSHARMLREAGYAGELRAEGDVLVDQLLYLRRCGFDSFAPRAAIDGTVAERALARYPAYYQTAADGAVPVWKLRHG